MAKTVRVCPFCGEQNDEYHTFCKRPSCGRHFGEIPITEVEDGPSPGAAETRDEAPQAKVPDDGGFGPPTEVASGTKGLLEVLELPGRVIRVGGGGVLGRGAENDLVEVPRSNLISRRHAQVIVEGDSAWIVD